MRTRLTPLVVILAVLGVLLLALAVVYLTVTAPHLPGFIPGHVTHVRRARTYTKRGLAALVLALGAFGLAVYAAFRMSPSTPTRQS